MMTYPTPSAPRDRTVAAADQNGGSMAGASRLHDGLVPQQTRLGHTTCELNVRGVVLQHELASRPSVADRNIDFSGAS